MTLIPPNTRPHERTIGLIKPDAYAAAVHGEILDAIQQAGLTVTLAMRRTFSKYEAECVYREHRGKPFFDPLITFICSGPLLVLLIEGPDAIHAFRSLLGAADVSLAEPHTLRARFGTGGASNAVHGSDSLEAARREYDFLFPHPIDQFAQLAS